MKFAYLRVATKDQNFNGQKEAILQKYPDIDEWIQETESGIVTKTQLNVLVKQRLRSGDQLIVFSLNRISQNRNELMSLLEDFQQKNITVHSIQENFDFTRSDGQVNP